MRILSKIFLSLLTCTLVLASGLSFNQTAFAEKKGLTQEEKLIEMGFSEEGISELYETQKEALEDLYDKSKGKAKVLSEEEAEPLGITDIGVTGVSDIKVTVVGSVDDTDSRYTYASIIVLSNIKTYVESSAVGVAFSDSWTIRDHEALTTFHDFWGDEILEWGELIDAVPKVGLAYEYDGYSAWNTGCSWTMSVDLRKPVSESGTTDFVGKAGYSTSSLAMGVSISASPSVNFSPSSKVYQKAATGNFDY